MLGVDGGGKGVGVVEVASCVGLNVRCGGVDVSEDVDLHDGGGDSRGLDGAGARW